MPGTVGAEFALLPHHAELGGEPQDAGRDLQRSLGLHAARGAVGECHAGAAAAMALRRSRYAGPLAPGWSVARSTLTLPSSAVLTGE